MDSGLPCRRAAQMSPLRPSARQKSERPACRGLTACPPPPASHAAAAVAMGDEDGDLGEKTMGVGGLGWNKSRGTTVDGGGPSTEFGLDQAARYILSLIHI